MLKVGLIGCGNAGNQVLQEALKTYPDMKLVAINSSENDLSTLPDSITKITIGDGKGCGKNRMEAKNSLASQVLELVRNKEFIEFMSDLELAFVISSTGGGTGSGMSLVFTNVIAKTFPSTYTIPVGILPTINEAESTQVNTLEYLTELYKSLDNKTTYMLYDNEKLKELPPNKMLPEVNRRIVEDINVLRCFYNKSTQFDSIDEKDALTVIRTPKRLMVASVYDVKEKDLDEMSLEERLMDSIKRGIHAEIQGDKIVNRTGIILNISESVLNTFSIQLPLIRSFLGDPIEEFKHIYVNEDKKLPNNAFLIISGLSPINDRIAKINDRITEIQEAQKRQEDDDELDDDLINSVNSKRVYSEEKTEIEQVDIQGIFSNFGLNLK